MDLAGSPGPGQLTSRAASGPGRYALTFAIGPTPGAAGSMTVELGPYNFRYDLAARDPRRTVSISPIELSSGANLVFSTLGAGVFGVVLDDVVLTRLGLLAAVPAPAGLALFGLSVVALGAARRRG